MVGLCVGVMNGTEQAGWVHLQVTPAGEILLGLPDPEREVLVNLALSPVAAMQLGEELYKAGATLAFNGGP
jgi:hypothetical protein